MVNRDRKKNLVLLLIGLIILILSTLLSCTGDKCINKGVVTEKYHQLFHVSTMLMPISTGKSCILMPVITTYPDEYKVSVRGRDNTTIYEYIVGKYTFNNIRVGEQVIINNNKYDGR